MKKKSIPSLAYINGTPCVTISMNTTGLKDDKELREELNRLIRKATALLFEKYSKTSIDKIVYKMNEAALQIDFEDHAKSITLYISETVQEKLVSLWEVPKNRVSVAGYFDVRPLVTVCNTSEEYCIVMLDDKEVRLYHASDNTILDEVKDTDFPLITPFSLGLRRRKSDAVQTALNNFFSGLDKNLICRYNTTGMRYVIAASPTAHKQFMQQIRFQSLYAGYIPVRAEISRDCLARKAWELLLMQRRKESHRTISVIKNLATDGRALTKYPDILQAVREGKGDLLVANEDVLRYDEEDDVSCEIVWDVIKHRGRVIFADRDEMEGIAPMALKVKY